MTLGTAVPGREARERASLIISDMRFPEPAAADWSFPRAVSGLRVLLAHAAAAGVPADRALLGTGLTATDLDGAVEVTAAQELTVVRTLRHLLGEVGAAVGGRYTAASFGAFGFALLASRTVGDAMAVALRFIDLSFAFAIPRADLDGDRVAITVDGAGLPDDVRRFLLERDATAVHRVLDSLVPGGVGVEVERGDGLVRLRFGVDQLDRPLAQRSAATLAAQAEVCAEVVAARRARTGLAQDVRVLVTQRLADGAPMPEVAAALAMTERTLRRRLRAEGTGYRELLDEVRSSLSEALLAGDRTLPVADLAARLGYADSAAYLHARARWERRVQPHVT